jgi:hypothetical protein
MNFVMGCVFRDVPVMSFRGRRAHLRSSAVKALRG